MKKTLALLFMTTCLSTHADVKVTASDSSGRTVMFMDHHSVLIHIGGENQSVLFQADENAFQHINHDEKSYMEFDQEMIKGIGGAMNSAMSQMQEALANLPPEQREMMGNMMGGMMPPSAPAPEPQVDIRKTGGKKTVQGYPCEKYIVLEDGKLVTDMWVTPYSAVKLSEKDLRPFLQLTKFQEEMMASFKDNPMAKDYMQSGMSGFGKIPGIPIVVTQYDNGEVVNEFKIESIQKVSGDAGRYSIPAGYQKQSIPGMSGGGFGF